MRKRQINVSLEKSPKDPLDELEEKATLEEKKQMVFDFAMLGMMCYAAKVAIDATATIAVNVALKGVK